MRVPVVRGRTVRRNRAGQLQPQMLSSWLKAVVEITQFGFEAQNVIVLRTMKIGAGGAAAHTEAARMIIEKAAAGVEAAAILSMGGSAQRVLRRYRARMRSNRRRLSR
jgi:hypothetical protein